MFLEKRKSLFIGRFADWFDSVGLVHGFSTRGGGVSGPPYASLNLGLNTDDSPDAVEENLKRFCGAAGIRRDRIAFTKQVHGDAVLKVGVPGVHENTDALVTDVPGIILAVQVADCVPLFLYDPVRRAVGTAHAGWKGSALGIAAKTLLAMTDAFGTRAGDVQAAIGPSIGPCCYEVGAEVAEKFPREYLHGNKLDLWQYNHDLMTRAGIPSGQARIGGLCTRCHSDWFFSHRAENGKTGRMLGVIGLTESA